MSKLKTKKEKKKSEIYKHTLTYIYRQRLLRFEQHENKERTIEAYNKHTQTHRYRGMYPLLRLGQQLKRLNTKKQQKHTINTHIHKYAYQQKK